MFNNKDPQWSSMIPEPGIYDITEGSHVVVEYTKTSPLFVFVTAEVLEQFKHGDPPAMTFATLTRFNHNRVFDLGTAGTLFHVIIKDRFNSKLAKPSQFFTHPSPEIRELAKSFSDTKESLGN